MALENEIFESVSREWSPRSPKYGVAFAVSDDREHKKRTAVFYYEHNERI